MNLLNDVRYCLRGFARRPLFAAVVVVTLALGLSINAAIFSIYDQILLRDLPVTAPHQLVNLSSPGPKQGSTSSNNAGTHDDIFSYRMFRDLERIEDGPFVGIAAHRYAESNLSFGGGTVAGVSMLVSGSYFPLLGLRPAIGRLLDTNDDRVDGEADAVVLAYNYWQSAFGSDPTVVGRTLIVNGKPLTIVGVGPNGFHGTTVGARPDVFVPITFHWLENPDAFPNHGDRRNYWAYLFARLKPGVTQTAAAVAANVPYRAINNELDVPLVTGHSEQALERYREKALLLTPGARGQSQVDENASAPLTILMVATGLVLLIASVNVANLLLARGSTRIGEISVRTSLGASRARLLTLLLVEVALLAAAAMVLSLPLTLGALQGVRSLLPAFAWAFFDFGVDATIVVLTCALALLSTFVFGLIPALKLLRAEVSPSIQTQSTRQTGGKAAARFRAALTTSQIALSMALLVVAGWFAQSLSNIANVDLGFRADSLAVFSVAPERNGYTPPQSAALFDRIEEDLARVPGVTSVSGAVVSLLAGNNWATQVEVEGYEAASGEQLNAFYNYVSPNYFRTVEMPLVTGMEFDPAGAGERKVAIVNERFAARYGLGADALGKRVSTLGGPIDVEIIGVVRDAKYSEVKQDIPPQIFMPRDDAAWIGSINFYLRSDLATASLRMAIEQVLARHDPNLPVMEFRTVTEQIKENVFLDRFISTLATALAVLATVLAAIGIYGVLSYGVVQRFREIGLRMALGAAPQSVRRMVLKQVVWMAAIGLTIGAALALLLGQIARTLLFGLTPSDPFVPLAAAAALAVVVLAAAYWPARRAARVDPVTALRGD